MLTDSMVMEDVLVTETHMNCTYVNEERNDEHDDCKLQLRVVYGVKERQL